MDVDKQILMDSLEDLTDILNEYDRRFTLEQQSKINDINELVNRLIDSLEGEEDE